MKSGYLGNGSIKCSVASNSGHMPFIKHRSVSVVYKANRLKGRKQRKEVIYA